MREDENAFLVLLTNCDSVNNVINNKGVEDNGTKNTVLI